MNKYRFILAAACLAACTPDKVRDFVPGTYVKSIQGQYSAAHDTLVITALDAQHYRILRHTAYAVIREGKFLPVQHKAEQFTAAYDHGLLAETAKGHTYSFDPVARTLTVNGKGLYQKIN